MVAVPTLKAMAYNLSMTDKLICPVMDARRDHVYGGVFHFNSQGELETDVEQGLFSGKDLVKLVNDLGKDVVFIGDGRGIIEKEEELLTCGCQYAPVHLNTQRASSVAALGWQMYKDGLAVEGGLVVPDYIRPSQAERELEASHVQYKTYVQ